MRLILKTCSALDIMSKGTDMIIVVFKENKFGFYGKH